MLSTLRNMNPEDCVEALDRQVQTLSAETERKRKWAVTLYETFIDTLNEGLRKNNRTTVEKWPLIGKVCKAFIIALGTQEEGKKQFAWQTLHGNI